MVFMFYYYGYVGLPCGASHLTRAVFSPWAEMGQVTLLGRWLRLWLTRPTACAATARFT